MQSNLDILKSYYIIGTNELGRLPPNSTSTKDKNNKNNQNKNKNKNKNMNQ